jgi:hypothetical protein
MAKKAVTILLAGLLTLSVAISLFLYSENSILNSQVLSLKSEIEKLKSANLVTALGVVEIPPYGESYWGGNGNYSYLWITGWVFNSGASMARKAGLEVLAFDEANAVLMNYTVPITEGGIGAYSTNYTLRNLIPYYLYPTPLEFDNVLSQQNVTVRLAIFHEGIFPNSTRYEINPLWENNQ